MGRLVSELPAASRAHSRRCSDLFPVKLASGNLAVFSPVALTPEAKEKTDAFGTVKYLAALDIEHHIFLGAWHQAYPDAKVIAMEGLPEKRAKQKNEEVKFDVVFKAGEKDTTTVDEEFDNEFDYEFIDAHANKELVFNYKRERTLIEADLIFNLPALEQYSKSNEDPHTGLLTRIFKRLNNTLGNAVWQRRFIWYAASSGDRPGFNRSIGKIDKWDFDRLIPCHGDVIETGAKGVFRNVLGWHLNALRKQEGTS